MSRLRIEKELIEFLKNYYFQRDDPEQVARDLLRYLKNNGYVIIKEGK